MASAQQSSAERAIRSESRRRQARRARKARPKRAAFSWFQLHHAVHGRATTTSVRCCATKLRALATPRARSKRSSSAMRSWTRPRASAASPSSESASQQISRSPRAVVAETHAEGNRRGDLQQRRATIHVVARHARLMWMQRPQKRDLEPQVGMIPRRPHSLTSSGSGSSSGGRTRSEWVSEPGFEADG